MPVITNIEDLKRIYERRVPRMFYDYAESGSWTEQTFRENSSDFDLIRLRQRVAVDMSGRSTATQMIGQDVVMPVALAPVGLTGMQHADGEMKAAKAAEDFGVPFTLSTMSINSIEDVAGYTHQALLVPALHHEGRGLREPPDPARQGCQMLRSGDHAGPAASGSAPQGPQERAFRAAQAHAQDHRQSGHQMGLGDRDAGRQAAPFRQYCGPREGGLRHLATGRLDRRAVRPDAETGARSAS